MQHVSLLQPLVQPQSFLLSLVESLALCCRWSSLQLEQDCPTFDASGPGGSCVGAAVVSCAAAVSGFVTSLVEAVFPGGLSDL